MTIEQTITIPSDRRVHIELPRNIPAGVAKFELIITPLGDTADGAYITDTRVPPLPAGMMNYPWKN